MSTTDLNSISEQLLLAVKKAETPFPLIERLAVADLLLLEEQLTNDGLKKAFWINIYNAFYQIIKKTKGLEKSVIYQAKEIKIGSHLFSLDDVEHGILRKYRYKFSLGFLPNFFTPQLIKKLAVVKVDYRIHFALNCGAASCPPIAFYSADKINSQLEMASLSFLESETEVLEDKKEIHVSRLFLWFLGDFGGKSGVRKILKKKLNLDSKGYKIVYKTYSWEEDLDNYAEASFND